MCPSVGLSRRSISCWRDISCSVSRYVCLTVQHIQHLLSAITSAAIIMIN